MRPLILSLALALATAGPAAAQTAAVDHARAEGVVGERYDGYLGLASAGGQALRSQVGAINIKRRSLYSELAAKRGVSPQEVGLTAGCQLLAGVRVGEAYLLSDGVWRRRAANAAAPQPDYCR